jgi:hypothetical protein
VLGKVAQQQDRAEVMVDRDQDQRGVGPGTAVFGQRRRQGSPVAGTDQLADVAKGIGVGHGTYTLDPALCQGEG